jgi:hypothetical protein
MSEREFWKLTPAQFFGMVEIVDERVKRSDHRYGILATVIRRVVGDKRAEIWDFFPSLAPARKFVRSKASELGTNLKKLAELKKGKDIENG